MFSINHVTISVSDIKRSSEFYEKFGFKEHKHIKTEGNPVQIKQFKLGGQILEIFCYENYIKLPKTATDLTTDLPVLGTKHFALGVDDIQKAKDFCDKNGIINNGIKKGRLGKPYIFMADPDGILVEIIEN